MENMTPLSRVEAILMGEPVSIPQSRVEYLLQELVDKMNELANTEIYKAKGSILFANLPTPAASNDGWVYDVTDDFVTDSRFKTGAGQAYPGGTNVVIINTGTEETPIYKYDVLGGFVNMDLYVQKEAGKGLSTNDYTDADKTKLGGIAEGAEVNVQSDWNESDNSSDTYIQNKPTLGTASALDVAKSGDAGDDEVVKGNDSRLTDDRNPTPHTHTASQIIDFPTLGTAAGLNVPATGDASPSEVVKGDDSRVVNSPIAGTTTGINPSITDSADGLMQDLTVWGKSRISKNLLDVQTVTVNNITFTVDSDKYITASPNNFDLRHWIYSNAQWFVTLAAGTYIIVYDAQTVTSLDTAEIQILSENSIVLARLMLANKAQETDIFTLSASATVGVLVKTLDAKCRIMICKKSDYDTDPTYEPYFSGIRGIGEDGEIDVVTCGKNWLDIGNSFDDWWRLTNNGTQFVSPYNRTISTHVTGNVDPETGTIVVSTYDETGYGWAGREVKLRKNTTYKVNASAAAGYWGITGFSSIGDNVAGEAITISDSQFNTGNYEHIFFVFYPFHFNFVGIGIYLSNETDMTFEPYVSTSATVTTGIPLYAVGDVKDELDERRGVVVKRCEKVVLDGSEDESWILEEASVTLNNSKRLYTQVPTQYAAKYYPPAIPIPAICDMLTPVSADASWASQPNSISLAGQSIQVRIDNIATVADLKTYLASNSVTVVYELATPTTQELTSTEKSALLNLKTFDSTTNVTVTDDPTSTVGYLLNTDNGQAVADAIDNAITGVLNTSY